MKKILGIVAGIVGIISVIVGVALKMNNNAIAIIGGADGPTSVFVAGKLNSVLVSILLIAIGVVMLIVAIIFYLKIPSFFVVTVTRDIGSNNVVIR